LQYKILANSSNIDLHTEYLGSCKKMLQKLALIITVQ